MLFVSATPFACKLFLFDHTRHYFFLQKSMKNINEFAIVHHETDHWESIDLVQIVGTQQ